MDAGQVPPLRHRDLWVRAKDAWQKDRSRASWIKAHLEWPEAERRGFSLQAWLGNQHADKLAGLGAAEHGLDQPTVDRVVNSVHQAKLMQSWFVRVLELLGDSPPVVPLPGRRQRMARPANPPRQQPRGDPGDHGPISSTAQGWQCGSCHRVVSFRCGWKEWRRIPCAPQRFTYPLNGPTVPQVALPAGCTAHHFETVDGRTRCVLCGRTSLQRWRSKLGLTCPLVPAAPPAQ